MSVSNTEITRIKNKISQFVNYTLDNSQDFTFGNNLIELKRDELLH